MNDKMIWRNKPTKRYLKLTHNVPIEHIVDDNTEFTAMELVGSMGSMRLLIWQECDTISSTDTYKINF